MQMAANEALEGGGGGGVPPIPLSKEAREKAQGWMWYSTPGGKSMVQNGYLTVREASSRSGLSKNQLTHLLRHGILQGSRIERVWLIREDSLKAYLANRPKPGPKKGSKKP